MHQLYKQFRMGVLLLIFLLPFSASSTAQHSVAREWNDLLLESIRNDQARPTVHARNLWHTSIAMYDVWAVMDTVSEPYFLGQTVDGYTCTFNGFTPSTPIADARNEAISYAMYRLLRHRFGPSDAIFVMFVQYNAYMNSLGYPTNFTSTDYSTGSAAALGNYIAQEIINFGLQDGSNEQGNFTNTNYLPTNDPLVMDDSGNPDIDSLDKWQPLTLEVFVDQSGNVIPGGSQSFLSPEWGQVTPFALQDSDKTTYQRNGFDYEVYHDASAPPYIDSIMGVGLLDDYKWGFSLVAKWSSHMDTSSNFMIDISPASIGNLQSYPTTIAGLRTFYNVLHGGDNSTGRTLNPATGMPYVPNMVKRADYARVLAEFWADGPDSETPPGHWFTLLHYVSDHPAFVKRFEGTGPVLSDLEWDVKSYFALGGAMHDSAITAWGHKGWYDYIRPVSAIRAMAEYGQSSNPNLPNFHLAGLPIHPGFAEQVVAGDPLAGANNEHVGKMKIYAWQGPDSITYVPVLGSNIDEAIDEAGVDWILAENWWPYQRPSFVTPNFAGYVSGHSTFSRAAAEVMTAMTGDAFFPGGMAEFTAAKNDFLVFEEGPSEDITLQWATYRDASDQCSLSRIWGGIHPPADDIPGRLMGIEIGTEAFALAKIYFEGICETNESLNTTPITARTYQVSEMISSTGTVASGTTVGFKAGTVICLDAGFEVELGAEFTAEMDPCN